MGFTNLSAKICNRGRHIVIHHPISFAATNPEEEITQNVHTALRVGDFRMELDTKKLPLRIFDKGVLRIFSAGNSAEASWQASDFVAMRIPNAQRSANTME